MENFRVKLKGTLFRSHLHTIGIDICFNLVNDRVGRVYLNAAFAITLIKKLCPQPLKGAQILINILDIIDIRVGEVIFFF
jgi:hypothetical protein